MPKINGFDITLGANVSFFEKGLPVNVTIKPASTENGFNSSILNALKPFYNIDLSVHKEGFDQKIGPFMNAYNNEITEVKNSSTAYGNGFVSVNWGNDIDHLDQTHIDACSWLAKSLDSYLGLPSLMWETQETPRKSFYKVGSFIPTKTGMEYLVLSCEWLKRRSTRNLIFNNTIEVLKLLFDDPEIRNKKFSDKTSREIIETNDKNLASEIFEYENLKTPVHYRNLLGISKEEDIVI